MTTPICTATWPGGCCERPAKKAGLCSAHYQRQYRDQAQGHLRGEVQAGRRRCVYVADEPWSWLVQRAGAQGVSVSELVRRMVAELADRVAPHVWKAGTCPPVAVGQKRKGEGWGGGTAIWEVKGPTMWPGLWVCAANGRLDGLVNVEARKLELMPLVEDYCSLRGTP